MEMFSQIIEKIITEAQQSSAQSIVNQARDITVDRTDNNTTTTSSPLSPTNSFTSSLTSQLSALKSPSDPFGGSFSSPVSPKITAATATAIQSNRYFVGYLITESSIELRDAINHQIIPLLDSLTTKILDLRKRCYSNGKDKSSRAQVTIFSIQISSFYFLSFIDCVHFFDAYSRLYDYTIMKPSNIVKRYKVEACEQCN